MKFYKAYIKEHAALFAISFAIWLSGALVGMYMAFSADETVASDISSYISSVIDRKNSFGSVFKNGVSTNFKYTISLCISSSLIAFMPATLFLIGFKGFSAGFTSVFLTRLYGLNGLGASLTAVAVPLFFSLPLVFVMFVSSLHLPLNTFRLRKQISTEERWKMQLLYLAKMLVLFALLCIITLFEALVSPWCFSVLK